MTTFKRLILVFTIIFFEIAPSFAGNTPSAPEINSGHAKKYDAPDGYASASPLDDEKWEEIEIPGNFEDFSKRDEVVKTWAPGAPRSSGSSTKVEPDCDKATKECRRSPHSAPSSICEIAKQLHQRCLKGPGHIDYAPIASEEEALPCAWLETRRSVLACYAPLHKFATDFNVLRKHSVHGDSRMLRDEKQTISYAFQDLESAYHELLEIWEEYLAAAFYLGMGIGEKPKREPKSSLQLPRHLIYKVCSSCKAEWRADNFYCDACGEPVINIAAEDFANIMDNLAFLFSRSKDFQVAVAECLQELQSPSEEL